MNATLSSLALELEQLDTRRLEVVAQIQAILGAALRATPAPVEDRPSPLPEPKREPRNDGLTAKVLPLLQEHPSGIALDAMAKQLEVETGDLRGILSNLKKQGKAQNISRGVWGPCRAAE